MQKRRKQRSRRTRVNTYQHWASDCADGDEETLVQQDIFCKYAPYGCTAVFQSTRAQIAHFSACEYRNYAQMIHRHSNPDSRTKFSVSETTVDVPNASRIFDRWLDVAPTQTYDHYNHLLGRPCRSSADYNDYTQTSCSPTIPHNQDPDSMSNPTSPTVPPETLESDDALFGDSGDTFDDDHAWDRMEAVYERSDTHKGVSSTLDGGSFSVGVSGPREEEFFRNSDSVVKYDDYTSFHAHLYSEIMQFKGASLAMYDNILSVISYWALDRNLDFNTTEIYRTRQSLLSRLTRYHGMQKFKAKLITTPISHGRSASVVAFDVIEVLCHMFADSRIFHPSNIAKGYDIWTGKGDPTDTYGEIHTGVNWEEAIQYFIENEGDFGILLLRSTTKHTQT